MSDKTIDVELLESFEDFVDAKIALDWAAQQKDEGVLTVAKEKVAEKKKALHSNILALTWVASAR